MNVPHETPSERVLATPELLELILAPLLGQLKDPLEREDPRSQKTRLNANVLLGILSLRLVNRIFDAIMTSSVLLKRGLFLTPDHPPNRSWSCESAGQLPAILRSFYRCPALKSPPILNPIAQTTFPSYHFRYWHLDPAASGNRYCAYMIITRDDVRRYRAKTSSQTKILDKMLLSQPPALGLEAMIWDDRDETKEYIGRTTDLEDMRIESEKGLTVGEVHQRVGELFDRHQDVPAIKLTTQLSVSSPAIEKDQWDYIGGFDDFLDCLRQLRTLQVLRLITYPSYSSSTQTSPDAGTSTHVRTTLQDVLKTAADKLFQTLGPACPKFLAVVLEVRGDFEKYFKKPHTPYAFLRTKQVDTIGASLYVGTPIEPHMVKQHVPCFDLLDPPTFIYD